jgi:hypothetical protein
LTPREGDFVGVGQVIAPSDATEHRAKPASQQAASWRQ